MEKFAISGGCREGTGWTGAWAGVVTVTRVSWMAPSGVVPWDGPSGKRTLQPWLAQHVSITYYKMKFKIELMLRRYSGHNDKISYSLYFWGFTYFFHSFRKYWFSPDHVGYAEYTEVSRTDITPMWKACMPGSVNIMSYHSLSAC